MQDIFAQAKADAQRQQVETAKKTASETVIGPGGIEYSKALPPKDVLDAGMLLAEACSAWPVDQGFTGLPPNPTYTQHRDLCLLAENPAAFGAKLDDTLLLGFQFGFGLAVALYLLVKLGVWARLKIRARRIVRESAETALARLTVEKAKQRSDARAYGTEAAE